MLQQSTCPSRSNMPQPDDYCHVRSHEAQPPAAERRERRVIRSRCIAASVGSHGRSRRKGDPEQAPRRICLLHAGALGGRACPCEGRGHDPVWPRPRRPWHRDHLRQFERGQGPGRAGAQDLAGSPGQGIEACRSARPRKTRCSRLSWPTTTGASPRRRRTARICIVRCGLATILRNLHLEGRAHAVEGADPAERQGDLHSGAERAGQGGDRQAGHRPRKPRR
jgi:hypothetical protein